MLDMVHPEPQAGSPVATGSLLKVTHRTPPAQHLKLT